ncbi:hypothetical protein B566_EDAN017686 [Ephemera danica]|nr:hypothetical protein B566_EDAN017686 [Ephemera danica]
MTGMQYMSKRNLWGWLNTIFNRVDASRIKEVGPDRACAEWLLRCGASVRWQNSKTFIKDYNSLPNEGKSYKIVEIDATDSAVMNVGFPHLRGLTAVEKMVLHRCSYLDDDALKYLPVLKTSLKHLQISSCGNITASGLQPIKELINLQELLLYDLPEIENREQVTSDLKNALPKCQVDFPYAQATEQQQGEKSTLESKK